MIITELRVRRDDLHLAEIATRDSRLTEGQAVFAVESFALTANNITYAAHGEDMGYWRFYPAPDGFGIVPVWGFGRVVDPGESGLGIGDRFYGYWPMASHAVLKPAKVTPRGFVDAAAHRDGLAAVYNAYQAAGLTSGDARVYALFRPLYVTSFLLDDELAEAVPDADAVILSSASSKTALGLARALRRRGVRVVGLTSAGNTGFCQRAGYYDAVVAYDAIGDLPDAARPAFVDFAGNDDVRRRVHARFGDALAASLVVGDTHWDAPAERLSLPGPKPAFFFAPTRLAKRMADWGPAEFHDRLETSWADFTASTAPWLRIVGADGADAALAAYRDTLAGRVPPETGLILSLAG